MAYALPLPWELLAPPSPAPRVALGHVDLVLVDVTRPESDRFRVRVYAEEFPAPSVPVMSAYVLYGVGVFQVSTELRRRWTAAGIRAGREARSPSLVAFDFDGHFIAVLAIVEEVARAFPP
ncbi:MAG TPA: hypothetical protein VJU16_05880 [Planctomycetota bacterium]|nr:hypothetical protein [Planctomycetota bacterium]